MRILPNARDIIVRLLVCAVNPVDGSSGSSRSPSSSSSSSPTNSPAKKQQRTEPKTEEETEEDNIAPVPFPKGVNLTPPPRQDQCVFDDWQSENKKLTQKLIDLGVAFDIKTKYSASFEYNWLTMNCKAKNKPCSYFVQSGDFGNSSIDCTDGKIGSTASAQRRFKEEYEAKHMNGIVLNDWDKYERDALEEIDVNFRACHSIIEESFKKKGGFQSWIKEATVQQCHQWEKEAGGFSIFMAIWMDMVFNKNGKTKKAVTKNLHIRHMEMANQLHYEISKGAMFEQLHFDVWDSFIIPNHKRVRQSTEELMRKMRAKLDVDETAKVTYEVYSVSVTWEPGFTFNTRQELTRKLVAAFSNKDLGEMTAEDMESCLVENCLEEDESLWFLLEDLERSQLGGVQNVPELVDLIFSQDDQYRELQLFQSATESFYDVLFGVINSHGKGLWYNPYPDRPAGDDHYDASNLNHKAARDYHKRTIQGLQNTVDKSVKNGNVYVALMDRTKTAYTGKHEGGLEKVIESQDFSTLMSFGHVTAYVYKSKSHQCLGLLLVHHAFSKAFTSRAPYKNQGPVRSEESIEDNSIAAVTFDWVHAVMMTVRGKTEDFKPTEKMLGNSVTAYAMIMYCLTRWHLGQSEVAVMFGKAMLTPENDVLNDKFGFKQKYLNGRARGDNRFKISESVAFLLSGANTENIHDKMKEVKDILLKDESGQDRMGKDGANISKVVKIMASLHGKLDKEGYLYKTLENMINSEIENREGGAKKAERARIAEKTSMEATAVANQEGNERNQAIVAAKRARKPSAMKKKK